MAAPLPEPGFAPLPLRRTPTPVFQTRQGNGTITLTALWVLVGPAPHRFVGVIRKRKEMQNPAY